MLFALTGLFVVWLVLPENYFTGVPIERVHSVELGMSRDECRQLLGEPHLVSGSQSYATADSWSYRAVGAGDLFTICFDKRGTVKLASF